MNRLLLALSFCFLYTISPAQINGYLYVKKGIKKKRTYTEGDRIYLQLKNDTIVSGLITLLMNDTIFLRGKPIPLSKIQAVLIPRKKNRFPADAKTMLLIGAGSGLTAVGLTLNDNEDWDDAIIAGLAIGYGGLITKYLGNGVLHALQRKKFRIGRKYRLLLIDFHIPRRRAF